jgi:transcriptional regulator with XRE-family HTH domain
MPRKAAKATEKLRGHALRNANLRKRSLKRSESAPPLARKAVEIRVGELGMTRIELARRSGISRGALRDLELGVHTPTRNTLERFIEFCEEKKVSDEVLDELRDLYAGPADSIENVIARLELRAGSSPKLARKVGVSAATMWEYRRGNFPVPHELLKKMCKALRVDFEPLEPIWHQAEHDRFVNRGFPEALAEFCVLRLRAGHAESDLLNLGHGGTATAVLPRTAAVGTRFQSREDALSRRLRTQSTAGSLAAGLQRAEIRGPARLRAEAEEDPRKAEGLAA